MKKEILGILILFIQINASLALVNDANISPSSRKYLFQSSVIDSLDTVYIDLSHAALFFGNVSIPVSIKSDDIVNALDFSFKYNHNNLVYDSISNLTNYIQAFSFYNSSDSTVRFTSNSIHTYQNDTALVEIHLTMLNGYINSSDIYSIDAYLNGDPCAVKLIDPLPMKIDKLYSEVNPVNLYPNPANGILNINTKVNSKIQMFNINGREVIAPFATVNETTTLKTEKLIEGVYLLRISNNNSSVYRKVIIEK